MDGTRDGVSDTTSDGSLEYIIEGAVLGFSDSFMLGDTDGTFEGSLDATTDGECELIDGCSVGTPEMIGDGGVEGDEVESKQESESKKTSAERHALVLSQMPQSSTKTLFDSEFPE
jgi:hypothetical protein